jgi:hypothetical protein
MQLFMSSEDDEDDTHIVTEQSSVQVCEQVKL